jgi:hypothetical protein
MKRRDSCHAQLLTNHSTFCDSRLPRLLPSSPANLQVRAATLRQFHRLLNPTSADMAGATTAQIMDVTGHRDPKSLRRYTRRELLHDPVLPKLFGA